AGPVTIEAPFAETVYERRPGLDHWRGPPEHPTAGSGIALAHCETRRRRNAAIDVDADAVEQSRPRVEAVERQRSRRAAEHELTPGAKTQPPVRNATFYIGQIHVAGGIILFRSSERSPGREHDTRVLHDRVLEIGRQNRKVLVKRHHGMHGAVAWILSSRDERRSRRVDGLQ